MKKIAVITMGVKLDGEKGYTRFRYLCEILANSGFQVDLITTTFQHWEKEQRDLGKIKKEDYPFGLKFIYEPGYKKNVDPRRIISHAKAAKNLSALLEKEGDYDLLYAEIPPNDVALAAAEYAKSKGIPFVADINDLWPEAMRMVLDIPVVSNILFHPLARDAKKVYSLVSGVVGTSDEYRDRPLKDLSEEEAEKIPRITVYVGNEISVFDEGVEKNKDKIDKPEGEYWIGYAGTIGTSYDIKTMVEAAEILKCQGHTQFKFKILGDGPTRKEIEKMAKEKDIDNVSFLGYTSYDLMAAYLTKCDVLVNSFVRKAPQSIVTKIGDYLSAGRPMINTCMSMEFRNKVMEDGFGINVEPEDRKLLAEAIYSLYEDKDKSKQMGERAREVAMKEFDRPSSYKKIVELIDKLVEK